MTVIDVPPVPGPILSVDDDPEFQDLLSVVYNRSSITNELVTLNSARACLEYMADVAEGQRHLPSIMLIDINMPRMDGIELIRRLRKCEGFDKIPLIAILSSSGSDTDRQRSTAVGADGYYEKPLRIFDLVFDGGCALDSADHPAN